MFLDVSMGFVAFEISSLSSYFLSALDPQNGSLDLLGAEWSNNSFSKGNSIHYFKNIPSYLPTRSVRHKSRFANKSSSVSVWFSTVMANSSRIFFSASTAESVLASYDASKLLRWVSWVHSMTFHSCWVSSGWHVPPLQGLLLLNIPNPITNEPFALQFLSSSGVPQCLQVKYAFFCFCLFVLFVCFNYTSYDSYFSLFCSNDRYTFYCKMSSVTANQYTFYRGDCWTFLWGH